MVNEFYDRPGDPGDKYVQGDVRSYLRHVSLAPDDRWLDAGAHIGAFSVAIAPTVEFVAAYEPEPVNFAYLEHNTEGYENVDIHPAALVGNEDVTRELFLANRESTGHSLVTKRGRTAVLVPARNINEAIADAGANKVKMDVEGAEWELLFAMTGLEGLRELLLEFHFTRLHDHPELTKFHATLDLLRKHFKTVTAPTIKRHWHCMIYASNIA